MLKVEGIDRNKLPPRRVLWTFVSLLVSISLVVYLCRYVDLRRFGAMLKGVPLWVPIANLGIYLLLNFWRVLRIRVLLNQADMPVKVLFPVVLYYNFIARTLPFMTGEVSYVFLIKRYLGRRLSEGVSSLGVARMFDLLVTILGGIIITIGFGMQRTGVSASLIVILSCLLAGMSLGMYFAGFLITVTIRVWKGLSVAGRLRQFQAVKRIEETLAEMPAQVELLRQPVLLGKVFGLSILIFASNLGFDLLLIRAIGVSQNLVSLLIAAIIVMITSWFPISLSGFGMIEGSWAMVLTGLTGMQLEQSTPIGFFLHSGQVIAYVLTGLMGMVFLVRTGSRQM